MVKFKRNSFVVALFFLLLWGTASSAYAEEQSHYELGLAKDITLSLSAVATISLGTTLYYQMHTPDHIKDSDKLLPWDKPFADRYSESADLASDIGSVLAVAPLTVGAIAWHQGASNGSEFATFTVMFAQAIAIGNGLNLAVRSLEIWPRPYIYAENGDGKEKAENAKAEAYGSFFSGHATAAFTVATFTDQWFRTAYPHSRYKGIMRATAYSLAGLESVLRVAAGKHFISDIVVGALVGTGVSLGILEIHRNRNENFSVWAGPGVMGITFCI
jgi:membrane-associated phospholipid phosphatase